MSVTAHSWVQFIRERCFQREVYFEKRDTSSVRMNTRCNTQSKRFSERMSASKNHHDFFLVSSNDDYLTLTRISKGSQKRTMLWTDSPFYCAYLPTQFFVDFSLLLSLYLNTYCENSRREIEKRCHSSSRSFFAAERAKSFIDVIGYRIAFSNKRRTVIWQISIDFNSRGRDLCVRQNSSLGRIELSQ